MSVPAILETHMAIVGTTGAGKTVTGKGYAEQLLEDGRQVVVIDPTGAWWGMQSNAAGDGPGLRIPVFGGLHGNAPIEPGDGVRVAELLVEQRVSAILDLSEMDEEEQRAFALAFVGRLRTKPIGVLHLVIDEADELAPEIVAKGAMPLKRALAWIAKRGRIRGFRLLVITQRPADMAKSVLALSQTLVVHRLIAPQDQGAIERYLKSHATDAVRKQVLGSLAGLQRGERWIYSPVEDVLERGRSPTLTTFDSSAAPVAGQEATEPQALADVDFAALAEALAASRPEPDPIAQAEARDPGAWAALVSRVDALEARSAATGAAPAPEIETARQSVPDDAEAEVASAMESMPPAVVDAPVTPSARQLGAERKPLAVLAGFAPAGLTDASWATVAGYKRTGGTWTTYRSRLRTAGLIEQDGDKWRATDAGVAAVGGDIVRPPAPGPALVAFWAGRIPGAKRMLLRLGQLYPRALKKDALAADLSMSVKGGTFGTYLSRLRGNGLLEEKGGRIRIAPALMGEDLA